MLDSNYLWKLFKWFDSKLNFYCFCYMLNLYEAFFEISWNSLIQFSWRHLKLRWLRNLKKSFPKLVYVVWSLIIRDFPVFWAIVLWDFANFHKRRIIFFADGQRFVTWRWQNLNKKTLNYLFQRNDWKLNEISISFIFIIKTYV